MNAEQEAARGDLYRRKLDHLTDEQWLRAVDVYMSRNKFFPAVAELLELAKPMTGHSDALVMFERVMDCYSYNPQIGTTWQYEKILRKLGRAAAEGFAAAGGPGAFGAMTDRDESFVYRRFAEAYLAAVRNDPQLVLPAGDDDDVIGPAEAKELLGGGE